MWVDVAFLEWQGKFPRKQIMYEYSAILYLVIYNLVKDLPSVSCLYRKDPVNRAEAFFKYAYGTFLAV